MTRAETVPWQRGGPSSGDLPVPGLKRHGRDKEDDVIIDTTKQVDRGRGAIKFYVDEYDRGLEPDMTLLDAQSAIGDLLADVFHYATSKGINPDHMVTLAKMHYDAERTGDF